MKNNYQMIISQYLSFILLMVTTLNCLAQEKTFQCTILGTVIDRPYSKELILIKDGQDLRVSGIKIPIENNQFKYKLTVKEIETYSLTFDDELKLGAMKPVPFFAEADTIHLTLYPMHLFKLNRLEGGTINQDFVKYQKVQDEKFEFEQLHEEAEKLRKEELFLTEEAYSIYRELDTIKEKELRDSLMTVYDHLEREERLLTPAATEIVNLQKKRFGDLIIWKMQQIRKQTTIITYTELVSLLKMAQYPSESPLPISIPELITLYHKNYKPAFPNHPYTQRADDLIKSMQIIKVGGKYIDFTAPDFEDNPIQISTKIKGKIALINLWASWCGPCRQHGKDMIPIYEAYKDKGFEVVGVARERKKENAEQAAKMDGYPWINLLELDDNQLIWRKYGIETSGGGLFLVDTDGTILAVSPTVEQVKTILESRLK
ncbi:TlpA disulfide reductase family protein [Sphingobacterium sp. xlx-130]|uniref:TlpA disulfide reductase family protein n=1 Tax=Sphingobacterium sp. xlx-130 TaxID=2654323 RepID=UPI0013D99F6D|nr:TlpA disulfide reductase family protein [Sphingobacterium sp. xlx-130]